MPVSAVWANDEQTAVLFIFQNPWTWAEFDAVDVKANELGSAVVHTVDYILDFRESGVMPDQALNHMKTIARNMRGTKTHVYVVGASRLLTMLGSVLGRVLPEQAKKVRPVASLDIALKLSAQRRKREVRS